MDKKRGMIVGVLLGASNRNQEYSGNKVLSAGSNMTLCLLNSINRNGGKYNREDVIISYMKWSGVKVKTQSNDSLMRCSPLALLKRNKYVILDCDITNPNDINREVNLIFVTVLRMCIKGNIDKEKIIKKVKRLTTFDEIKVIFEQENRDIMTNKGWCVHSLWCAIYCLKNFDNFEKAMKWVITSQRGSDTNASIAGALLGAYLGFDEIMSHPKSKYNYELICKVNNIDVLDLLQ